jgi:regulatory protein
MQKLKTIMMQNIEDKQYRKILNYALILLGQRRYTEKKLHIKLASRFDNADSEISRVIERLKELKYINDFDYAVLYINSITKKTPCGRYLIKQKLKLQGINEEIIRNVFEPTDINEENLAFEAFEKKNFSRYPLQKRKQKALFFLKSRGFPNDIIYKILSTQTE